MHYVYLIQSLKDREYYTGYTNNLKDRLARHNCGEGFATKGRKPFKLIYYEACLAKDDAIARERYLKSGRGKKYLRDRVRNSGRSAAW